MDGRDRAECQNWENKDKMVIFGIVKLEKDKIINRACLLQSEKREKKRELKRGDAERVEKLILERTSYFYLKYRAIRTSAVFGTRRKAALRGAGYEWTPDLRSFDKIREVGLSPYLGFTLYLRVFEWFG